MAPKAEAGYGGSNSSSTENRSTHCTKVETGAGMTYFSECRGKPVQEGSYDNPVAWQLKPAGSGDCKIVISGTKDSRVFVYNPCVDHDIVCWPSAPLVVSSHDWQAEKALKVLQSCSMFNGLRMGTYHNVNYKDLISSPMEALTMTVEVAGAKDTYQLSKRGGQRHYQDPVSYWFDIERDERQRVSRVYTVQSMTEVGEECKVMDDYHAIWWRLVQSTGYCEMDKDGDGRISKLELKEAVHSVLPLKGDLGPRTVEDIMAMADLNQNCFISKAEFLEVSLLHLEAFADMDTNGDGYLDRQEVRQVVEKIFKGALDEDEDEDDFVDIVFERLDKDRDGKLSFDEIKIQSVALKEKSTQLMRKKMKVTLAGLTGRTLDIIVEPDATWASVCQQLGSNATQDVVLTSNGQALLSCQKVSDFGLCKVK